MFYHRAERSQIACSTHRAFGLIGFFSAGLHSAPAPSAAARRPAVAPVHGFGIEIDEIASAPFQFGNPA